MRRFIPSILIISLLCVLFSFPAFAGENAQSGSDEAVDIVTMRYSNTRMAALMADGTVRTSGLEDSFDAAMIDEIESWTDIVQLVATATDFLGLKSDGSVVSTLRENLPYRPLEDPFDPNHWTNVKELVTSESEYYGLTNDGKILVSNDQPVASFGGGGPYLRWEGIEKICFFAYPEARGLFGLRSDGTVLRDFDYYPFHETPTEVVEIDSSGYIDCALRSDGTLCAAGPQIEYAEGLLEKAEAMTDVVQIAVDEHVILCRLRDGSAEVCASTGNSFSAVHTWQHIRDVQIVRDIMVGLDSFGRVHTAVSEHLGDRLPELRSAAESWTEIIRIKAYDGFGYDEPYILGWRSDGTVLAAGLDISGLDLKKEAISRYTDAFVMPSSGAVVALRDDGTVSSAGLSAEAESALSSWRGITQICYANTEVYGLRSDGYVEAVNTGVDPYSQSEVDKALAWREIAAIVSTHQRLVGLRKDGSIVVTGPEHFGTEQVADYSDWTGLYALEGGDCIGGEYLVGIKGDGIVLKGASLVGAPYGTPRRVTETACSGFDLLCKEQDGSVTSIGFPNAAEWQGIEHVWALDGLGLGLRRDGTVALDVQGTIPEEAVKEIEGWKDIRNLSVARDDLIVGITIDGRTLIAESDWLIRDYGQECIDTIKTWTNLDRILGVDYEHHVLALRKDGTLVSYGLSLP